MLDAGSNVPTTNALFAIHSASLPLKEKIYAKSDWVCWYHILSAIVDYIFRFYTFILRSAGKTFAVFISLFLCVGHCVEIGMEENRISEMEESWPRVRKTNEKEIIFAFSGQITYINIEWNRHIARIQQHRIRHIVQHQPSTQTRTAFNMVRKWRVDFHFLLLRSSTVSHSIYVHTRIGNKRMWIVTMRWIQSQNIIIYT